jgi:hypothetical protein
MKSILNTSYLLIHTINYLVLSQAVYHSGILMFLSYFISLGCMT